MVSDSSDERTDADVPVGSFKYALGFTLGVLLMVYAFESYHWYGYMKANPTIGPISGSGSGVYLLVFAVGTFLAFSSFVSCLRAVVADD